jgi:PKD repeat protein
MVSHQEVLCDREVVQFEDYSILDHTDATWEWSFPGAATVSSYTARNPQVTYEEVGNYEVSLTVTTPAGSSTKTIPNMVQVSSSLCSPEEPPLMAAECTATGDYLVNASVNETGLTEFTFTGWVKPNGIQADYSGIFSLSNGEGANKNVLNFREGNNTLGFHWNGAQWWWDSNLIVPADEWSFVAITVTANAVTLFVNESEATLNMVTEPYDITAILMGTYYYWSSRNYVGLLEEATFWKRALTKDEIRLSRHLTKQDLSDPDLICYYQFNHNANNVIFDKKGILDLSMSGNTNLVSSDAPVGPGFSDILEITEIGSYTFPNSQVQMSIDNAAAVPNGKVVLSRINILPSSQPSNFNLDEVYWIANNYGTNQSLLNLEQIQFDGVPAVSTANDYSLYNRLSNDGITGDWLEQGSASEDSGSESLSFDASAYPLLFNAQYFIGADELTGTQEQALEFLHIYPNPVSSNDKLYLKGVQGEARLTLYNTNGKVVLQQFVSESQNYITLSKLPAGQYFYAVQENTSFYRGKLTIQ